RGVADRLGAALEQKLQDFAFIVRSAANDGVKRGVAPRLAQPFEIGFETTRGRDDSFRADGDRFFFDQSIVDQNSCALESTAVDTKTDHFGVVEDPAAFALRGCIVSVHQGFAAAEEESVDRKSVV